LLKLLNLVSAAAELPEEFKIKNQPALTKRYLRWLKQAGLFLGQDA